MRKLVLFTLTLVLFIGQVLAQNNRTVRGKVLDEKGNPLDGVTVSAKGFDAKTATDKVGNFTIVVPNTTKLLEFSYLGYASQSLPIPASGTITVVLKPSVSDIGDVVVTGYQKVKKSEYVGAVSKVTADKINYIPSASFDQIIQGKAPGLLVTSGSGQPGTAARVQIRGAGSINGNNDPLYILDGMPIEAGVFQSLNPNDFESVDILKDAVSTAPYGNRGSGGVIVITTKKGASGKTTLTYNVQTGRTETGTQRFDMMNSSELLQYQEILGQQADNSLPGWVYSKKNPVYATLSTATKALYDAYLDSLRGINTDWSSVFFNKGTFTSHDLSLAGGGGGTRFFLSGGYYNEDGIALRSNLKRYTFRSNLDYKSDKLLLSFNSTFGYTKRNFIESENSVTLANPFAAAYLGLPYHKLFKADGTTVDVGSGKVGPNAYARVYETGSFNDQYKANAILSATYSITKNIYVGGSAGLDYRHTVSERSIYPGTFAAQNAAFPTGPQTTGAIAQGSYSNGFTNFREFVVKANAGYKKIFAGVHDVDVQVISEFTNDKNKSFSYTGYGINPKLLNTPAGITPGTSTNLLIPAVGGSKSERALWGTVALAKYIYKGKYVFNTSFRRDASSQLPEKNRFANFYSVGAAWNILKENFATKLTKVVNELKLRTSYGTSANSDGFSQGYYGYLSLYGSGTYNGVQTIVPSNIGSNDLKWEVVKQFNLGLDFALLKNRVKGAIDLYNKKSTDVIVDQTLPLTLYTTRVNAATVVNKGVELSLSAEVISSHDFVWSVGGNVAYNKNEVTSLGQVNEFELGTSIVRVGLPIGSHYAVKWGGVDAATGSPLYYTKEGKLTPTYSNDYQVADFGTYNAPWIGGFNTTFSFKGISVGAFFNFQQGFSRFNNQDYFQLNHAFALQGYNLRKENLTIWQKPGDVTDLQVSTTARQFSSKDIQDASYLRFRNLNVSYDLPASIFSKQNVIRSVKIYGQAQNLYTWTNWTGFDPEDDDNIAQYEYPVPRTYTIGLNITFK